MLDSLQKVKSEISRIITHTQGLPSLTADALVSVNDALERIAERHKATENLLEETYSSIDFRLNKRRELEKRLYKHLRKIGRKVGN